MEENIKAYHEILDVGDAGTKKNQASLTSMSVLTPEKELNHENPKQLLEMNTMSKDSSALRLDIPSRNGKDTKESKDSNLTPIKESTQSSFALKHMHELYETVAEITVEPAHKDEPDVKAFFKVLRKHRMQSKVTYVMTVAGIVLLSHCVLTRKWLMPYLYSVLTPSLLFFRLIMYWKMKYQYFMLDFCYFANIYCFIYLCLFPQREDMFAVGYSIAAGPLIWALLIFRNSLVLHSIDKVTSLYIHLMPCLLTFVIRWYPEEASSKWHKPFPKFQFHFNFLWLVLVPMCFHVLHQVIYFVLVNLILKPSSDYLNLFRYVTRKEGSLQFRLCNLFGPRYRILLYTAWSLLMVLGMLFLVPLWYNYFIANSVMLVFFCATAAFNGATYYVDVFSFEGAEKSKSSKSDISSIGSNNKETTEQPPGDSNNVKSSQTVVVCSPDGEGVETRVTT
ncbi:hypothetical protein ElyMa_000966800 [Elysia marginata]|uniref:Glycerophosphocholine acyltransferase 1 n=1 Tax=Elysia marginata TaxID=1093978 RepID=A0AAV4HFK4_9GAST|nr:hypothetical protein ElyMa_000966800 [Elysia marginata]